MNNFNNNYLVKSMHAFAIMLSVTATVTYLAAGLGYYALMIRGKKKENREKDIH
jgi:hypothetical protein